MTLDDLVDDFGGVWPEHVEVCRVFEGMSTQWLTGSGGPIGFDYKSLEVVFPMMGVKKKRRAQVFHELRVMESEALVMFQERQAEKARKHEH